MITIQPIAGALGAEITGVDLAQPLSNETMAAIHQAFLDHLVIFFRDQELDSDQYLAFARRFGTPNRYPFLKGLDDHPDIIAVTKLPHETVNFGGVWHADTTYLEQPPVATMLLARETPAFGGDTLFASQYLAYETLSDGMKALLGPLRGVSHSRKADASRTREDRIKTDGAEDPHRALMADHPVVRTHPETGRKSLYVSGAHTICFKGMTEDESRPILTYLHQHQVRPEFTCRFAWRPGSLAIWDNRCAMHYAVNDYPGQKRVMHRITLVGETPV